MIYGLVGIDLTPASGFLSGGAGDNDMLKSSLGEFIGDSSAKNPARGHLKHRGQMSCYPATSAPSSFTQPLAEPCRIIANAAIF